MKRLIVALAALALIAAPAFAQGVDTDADGIPDAVEYTLGSDPERAEEFVPQWHDGTIGDDDTSVSDQHADAPDFVDVLLANVAQDRWLWKITFAEDYVGDTNTFILYLDADGDLITGRQEADWVRGTDLMFVQQNGGYKLARHTEGMAPGELRMTTVGNAIYVCEELPLGEGPGQPRFRVLSHVSPPKQADSDQMELQPVIVPERRDAPMPRTGPPADPAPLAELTTDRPDRDGDGVPDDVEEVLGMAPDRPNTMHLIGTDGTLAGGDETQEFTQSNDIAAVYFGNAAGDRWVWRIDFADEFQTAGRLIILYLDCDNDRSTGRQEYGAVQGTDMMLTWNRGSLSPSVRNADVLSDNRNLRGMIDGKSLYLSMDLKLAQNREGNSEYRASVLSQFPEDPADNDSTEWLIVAGPGQSDEPKPRIGSLSEIYSEGVWVEVPWLYWREQLRDMNAVSVDLAEAELSDMHLDDHAPVADAAGATATVLAPVAGDYHLNVVLQDSAERREEVRLAVGGRDVATMVAAANNGLISIFSTPEPISLTEGEPITFTSDGPAQDGRICELTLTREMLLPPGLALDHVSAYCPPGQRAQAPGDAVAVDVCFLSNDACTARVEWGAGDALDRAAEEERSTYSHRIRLEGLERGATYSYRITAGRGDSAVTDEVRTFVADFARPERCGVDRARMDLMVTDPVEGRPAWPVSGGVPIPEGHLRDAQHCRVMQGGTLVAADFRELAWWPDGSVKWLLVSLLHTGGDYALEYGQAVAAPEVERPIVVAETPQGLRVTTDVLQAEISRERFSPPGDLWRDLNADGTFAPDEQCIAATEGALLVDADGNRYSTAGAPVERLVVEEAGPVRTVVMAEGHFTGDAGGSLGWRCRMYFTRGFAGVPTVFTLLGDQGETIRPPTMTLVKSLEVPIEFPVDLAAAAQAAEGEEAAALAAAQQGMRLLHDYDNHYVITRGDEREEHVGHTNAAVGLAWEDGGARRSIAVTMRDFWQLYPKAYSAEGSRLSAEIFPELPADQYADQELTPLETTQYYYWRMNGAYGVPMGVALSYDLLFYSYADTADKELMDEAWDSIPLLTPSPEHYCVSGAFGDLEPEQAGVFDSYQQWIDDGFELIEQRRERVREYDWLSFGDTWGERMVNWTNQEYDLQWGLLVQFARSGDWRYFARAEEAARHTAAVDTINFAPDQSVLGLQKAHCLGHVGGYEMVRPENAQYWFNTGIWNTGHMWSQGVMSTWCLTGDRRYLDAGLLQTDWFAREETRSIRDQVHRAQGWSTIACLGGYDVIPHPWYLNAARLFSQNAIARQDPGTGTFIHGIGECEHDVRHVGGKAFMTGVVMSGMKMLDQIDPDEDLKNSLVRSADWLHWRMWHPQHNSFQYAQCTQFDPSSTHAGTFMLCEGLAYAYELAPKPEYREMLERSLGDMILNRGPSGSGKGYAMDLRTTPFALSAMQRWGMTALPAPPAPDPTVGMADSIYLPAGAPGLLALRVNNPSRQAMPASVEIAALPDGLTADRTRAEWTAGGGASLSPTIRLSGDAIGAVTVRYAVGETQGTLTAVTRAAGALTLGEGVGLVTGEADPVAAALASLGVELPALPDLSAGTLGGYRALLVGSEAQAKDFGGLQRDWPMLLDFIGAGGRVAFMQLQDGEHEPGFLPLPLTLSNDSSSLAEVLAPDAPLFAGGAAEGLRDCISYDTITAADPGWTVLARDRKGNPSIVEASVGDGAVLVVQPSPDRYVISAESPAGSLTVEACGQLLRNVVAWLQAQ